MPEGEPSFWQFSLDAYAQEEVEQACLFLQDEHGSDVNILLLCCFVARHGVRLPRPSLEILIRQATAWQHEVVAPLRAVRRRLKQPVGSVTPQAAEALRAGLKDLELEAERLEQETLQAVLRTVGGEDGREADRPGLARRNLLEYLAYLGIARDANIQAAIEVLIRCAATAPLR